MSEPKWPLVLADERKIASYIAEQSTGYVDEEMIEELYSHSHARLEKRRIDSITEGNADGNVASPSKQKRYAKLGSASRPPIVLDYDDSVADGNHRLRDAISRGEEFIWCYVPYEGEYVPEGPTPGNVAPKGP